MSFLPSGNTHESKPCRARCCACAKKIKKMNKLLEDIPKLMVDPSKMCDHCIKTKGTCKKCQFYARLPPSDKTQCNDMVQRFLSEWAIDMKKLQHAINTCKDTCDQSYDTTKQPRVLDIDSINYSDIRQDTCSDTGSNSDLDRRSKLSDHKVNPDTSKKRSHTHPNTPLQKSKEKKIGKSKEKKTGKSKEDKTGKSKEDKQGDKTKQKKETAHDIGLRNLIKSCQIEGNNNYTQFEISNKNRCQEKLLTPEIRDSLINLEQVKQLVAFDDTIKTHRSEKIIRNCRVVKYEPESELDYDIPERLSYKSENTDLSSNISLLGSRKTEFRFSKETLRPGKFRYALSDRRFITKGWTMLPTLNVMRLWVFERTDLPFLHWFALPICCIYLVCHGTIVSVRVYPMSRTESIYDWFERNRMKTVYYDTGEVLGYVDMKKEGNWYYKSGTTAFYKGRKECIIYSDTGCKNNNSSKTLAWFDQLGNGVIYDMKGNIRVQYNQLDGCIVDKNLTPPNFWCWYITDEKPRQSNVYVEKVLKKTTLEQMKHNSNAVFVQDTKNDMMILEHSIFAKFRDKKHEYVLSGMRTKVFKINEHFTLRIVDQEHIYVTFFEGTVHLRFNVGMIMDRDNVLTVKPIPLEKGIPLFIPIKDNEDLSEDEKGEEETTERTK